MRSFDLGLYVVLDPGLCGARGLVRTALEAVAGGATMIQLRDKNADTAGLIEIGRALMAALCGSGVPLIVNDDPDAALAIGADGLHIGQDDIAPNLARRRIGPEIILGMSVETEALAAQLDPAVVDYAGAGPVFATRTKSDHKPPVGLDGLERLIRAASVPCVAIGGLKEHHVAGVLAAGAQGMAVGSAICGAPEPRVAAMLIAGRLRDHSRAALGPQGQSRRPQSAWK